MSARCVCHAAFSILFLIATSANHADIYRWDTGEVIPGTEGIEPGPGVDLSGMDLALADLEKSNLTGANLTDADLRGAHLFASHLAYSTLTNADLTEAHLQDADLEFSTLRGANLTDAYLAYSMLTNADLTGANLTNATLGFSALNNAELSGAVITGAGFGGWASRFLTAAQLYSTQSYQDKNLQSVGLSGNLSGWKLSGQDLTNAHLGSSTLTNADLTGANLKNAYLRDARDLISATVDATSVYNQWTVFPSDFDPVAAGLTRVISHAGDLDADDVWAVDDVDMLANRIRKHQMTWLDTTFDLNSDEAIDFEDHRFWVKNLAHTWYGDANLDGEFNTGDFVQVLEAGKYEKGWVTEWGHILGGAAGWAEGDWNGDGVFDTGDLVKSLEDGGYEQGPRTDAAAAAAVPEPEAWGLWLVGMALLHRRRR